MSEVSSTGAGRTDSEQLTIIISGGGRGNQHERREEIIFDEEATKTIVEYFVSNDINSVEGNAYKYNHCTSTCSNSSQFRRRYSTLLNDLEQTVSHTKSHEVNIVLSDLRPKLEMTK